MKRIIYILFVLSTFTFSGFAQNLSGMTTFDQLLASYKTNVEDGKKDLEQILEGYLNPFMQGIGFGMANGWLNTAKPHQVGGFDFTLSVNTTLIPETDSYYTIGPLREVELISPADGNVPTLFGPNNPPTFQHKTTGEQFEGVGGIDMKSLVGINAVPLPMAQLSFGLPLNSEIKLRYVPKLTNSQYGVSVGMFGVGIMHELNGYIPGAKKSPVKLSAFGAFNRFSVVSDLSDAKDGSQTAEFHVNAYTVQAIGSAEVSIFTFYGSLGATQSQLNLALKGDYSYDNDPNTIEITDPVDMKFGGFSPRGSLGFRMKFAILTLHSDFTFQKYNTFTVGLGFSVK